MNLKALFLFSLLCWKTSFSATFLLPPKGTDIVGEVKVLIARPKDTLLDIARRYDLGYNEITEANPGVDVWLPGEGTRIILPTQFVLPDAPRRGIVIDVAAMRLYYYPRSKHGNPPVVMTYPLGIGRFNWETPEAVTRIVAKIRNPVWHAPQSIREEHEREGEYLPESIPPGPDNPLGRYAMPLAISGYLIHGTNKPYGIGLRVSHGCIHLYPEDIAQAFKRMTIGTPVRIVDQPYLAGWLDGRLYLEAHKPLIEDMRAWHGSLTPVVKAILAKNPGPVDWKKAMRVARDARSVPIRISRP